MVNWVRLDGYSLAAQLAHEGLNFDTFGLIRHSVGEQAVRKVRGKIVARLGKDLRADCLTQHELDIQPIKYGCYVISLDGGFELQYEKKPSPVLYIGSGYVYGRMKSHLSGKLFDFASQLHSIPFSFWVSDLSEEDDPKNRQRHLEQALLQKFQDKFDSTLPLLNSNQASASKPDRPFSAGWDRPLQSPKGSKTTQWVIRPADTSTWKGALQ